MPIPQLLLVRVHPWEKVLGLFFARVKFSNLSLGIAYKNVAFCYMNCIKQFISFLIFGVNPLRFSGH